MKLLELQPLCFFLSLKRCTCGNNDRRGHRIGLLSCGKGYSQLYCMDMQINQKCVRHNRKLDPLSSVKAMQNDVTGQYIVKCWQNISFNRFQSFGLKCFFFFKVFTQQIPCKLGVQINCSPKDVLSMVILQHFHSPKVPLASYVSLVAYSITYSAQLLFEGYYLGERSCLVPFKDATLQNRPKCHTVAFPPHTSFTATYSCEK